MNLHEPYWVSVMSYRYFNGDSQRPLFVYVEKGYDKSVLPKPLREIVGSPQVMNIDIAQFGDKGQALFLKNHYLEAKISFSENG